jgi:bifunctional UDP-N-acetylglucosamine pyrophosphorylase/glucosamine-1-phosphate N-acetyltransferase
MKSATPKVLHPLAGIPMVSHVLATAEELGAAHIVAVVRHERDTVAAVISEHLPGVIIVDQDESPGTGRAVELGLAGLPADFSGHVVVLSADVPLLDAATVGSLLQTHENAGNALTLLSANFADPTGAGRIVRGEDGAFEAIVEQKDATDEQREITEINAGVYVFDSAALRAALERIGTDNAQNEKYLTDAAAGIRATGGRIEAVAVADPWLVAGINDRAQLAAAAGELNARIVRGWQLSGVTIQDPATTWIDLATTIAADVEILPGTQLKGATAIERGAIIGPDTTLVDCEVGENAVVKRTDATLAVIGANALVGPFAYLRPGTYLGERGKIGTFVETKNSRIGAGSKVPHLSYIGDTTIGEHTNLGAGAITANYDDIAKHHTEIGSHVHTGSHNVFVAPVTIGNGAKTGAGTIVRKDVPAGALAMTVAPQRNVIGWVEKNRAGTASAAAASADSAN